MEKLFLNNPYFKNFKANILEIQESNRGFSVILDKTAFYPEGGGQPCDTGIIDGCNVSYVYEDEGIIYHVLDRKPRNFTDVDCCIDWDRRFDHMQQHCGQHILSAAFISILNAGTVGFHLGDEFVTIDLSINSISMEDIEKAEETANNIVFSNLPVIFHYPKSDELSQFKLRKPPSVNEDIRIVEIDGFDFSPCCGTHPLRTGDVGLIKIRKWEKNKDTIRVEFVCGKRALKDYTWKNRYINEISNILSSKDMDVLENVGKSINELHSANKEIKQLKDKNLEYEAEEFISTAETVKNVKIVKRVFADRDFKDVTYLAGKISKHSSVIALLGVKSSDAKMVFTRSTNINIKINEVFKEVLPLINGKGGGSPQTAQGGGTDTANLESALDGAYLILKNRYL